MCHKLDLNEALKVFGFSDSDELHDFKEMIKQKFSHLLTDNNIGKNPDLAWCGDENEKQLCLKSQRNKGKEECTSTLISEL